MLPIIECVPNFSEGKNLLALERIAAAIRAQSGVKLLHIDIGAAAHRTVMTFAGAPEAVVEAAFQAISVAKEVIDMRFHKGEHPRIGATDVCPLVPVQGISPSALVPYALQLAKRVGEELQIPVYLYEMAASKPERKRLADIRQGEYEQLAQKMKHPAWVPDFGPKVFNARAGATVIGARPFLIAYNVNLDTTDVAVANQIAYQLRGSGHWTVRNGKKVRLQGKFPSVRAIGWYIAEYGKAQVSMNLTDFSQTSMYEVMEACKEAASANHVKVTGSELIGLVPLAAILETGKLYAGTDALSEAELVSIAIQQLGLNDVKPFDPQKHILEYAMRS